MASERPRVSVVIATVGRPEQLATTLAAHERLDPVTPSFEVVVVLDGPSPAAREVASVPRRFPVKVLQKERGGIGPAKNLGAERAMADYVVFLNDDTRPAPGCLLAHLRAQRELGPCIVLGHVDWDPEKEITPYMRWLAPAGHQFNFSRLDPTGPISWDACWGAHLGLPREWVLDEQFDPDFPFPSLEDGEWGYRQFCRGRPLRYVPDAVCLHHHRYDGPGDYRPRARISGAAARYTVRRHRSLTWKLTIRPLAVAVAASILAAWPGQWRRETLWDLDFRWNFVWGIATPQSRHRLSGRYR